MRWQYVPTSCLLDMVLGYKKTGGQKCYGGHDQRWQISAALRYLHSSGSRKAEANMELSLWVIWGRYDEQLPRKIFLSNSPPGALGLTDFTGWKTSKWRNSIWQGHNGLEREKLVSDRTYTIMYYTHILQHGTDIWCCFPRGLSYWFVYQINHSQFTK